MEDYEIRKARTEDVESIVEMVRRLKMLNGEFDRHFSVRDDFKSEITKYLKNCIEDRENFVIEVAEQNSRIIGVLKIDIHRRIYYKPEVEARITEFYIMPEFRRKNVGKDLMNTAIEVLKSMKVEILTTEFPTLNLIAMNFAKDNGFKEMISILVRDL